MAEPMEQLLDLIFGRWRSQILYAGAALGVFDRLTAEGATSAAAVAPEVGADAALLHRLLRSLASIGLLAEDADQSFRLTEGGALLREDHPHSLKAMALLEEGPEHYAIWKHLVEMVRDGRQNGFMREFGRAGFDYPGAGNTSSTRCSLTLSTIRPPWNGQERSTRKTGYCGNMSFINSIRMRY